MTSSRDCSQSFLFQNHPIKGLYVNLTDTLKNILACHNTTGNAAALLGENLLAACCLLQPMKINGTLTVQFQSHGTINMLVAKATTEGELRGIIGCDGELEAPLLGAGHLVVTVQGNDSPHASQSLIAVAESQNIAQSLTRFFAQSEQLPSLFIFTADEEQAVGMMLQRMPDPTDDEAAKEAHAEAWNEVTHLFYTLKAEEMQSLPASEILRRLFHEHDLRVFDPKPLCFKCPCSQEKMSQAILTLGEEEALAIIDEQKRLEVTCEYCKAHYGFTRQDVKLLFEGKDAPHH